VLVNLVDIAFTIDGLESEPTVAIKAAVGIDPFFGEGLEIGDFLSDFHFGDEDLEIVSLCADSGGRCQAHHGKSGPKGLFGTT